MCSRSVWCLSLGVRTPRTAVCVHGLLFCVAGGGPLYRWAARCLTGHLGCLRFGAVARRAAENVRRPVSAPLFLALAGERPGRVPWVRISCFKKLPAVSSWGGGTTSLPPRKRAVPAGAHLHCHLSFLAKQVWAEPPRADWRCRLFPCCFALCVFLLLNVLQIFCQLKNLNCFLFDF